MNAWFSLVRPGTHLEYIQPGVMLQRVLTHRQEMQILRGWDDPTRFHRASLDQFVRTVLPRVDIPESMPLSGMRQITVLDRAPSPDFYVSSRSETFSSGADWRSMPNTHALADALSDLGNVTVLDAAALSPQEQVQTLAGTDLLVAQHGAGLSNMVWLPPGGSVLEIKPPLMPIINEIFANLASARNLNHMSINQQHENAPADIQLVVEGAERLLDRPGAFTPTMTGRLPMRIIRQMPRRL